MMDQAETLYAELLQLNRRTSLLNSCSAVLGWERETFMPRRGAELRAEQLSLLAGVAHQWSTDPRIGELLQQLEEDQAASALPSEAGACLREIRRTYDRATALPQKLVEALSHTTALAQQQWAEARKTSQYSQFAPWLEKIVALKREEAAAVGWPKGGCAYDALLDEYEPGATSVEVRNVFRELRAELVPLIATIGGSTNVAPVELLRREYPVPAQKKFVKQAATAIGFEFDAGRLDVAEHPFCSGFGPGDCRLTTRYDERFFSSAFFGTLHEVGHGLYEQGLPEDHFGSPLGAAASLGIHESQSRLWENLVGRSESFWQHFYPLARQAFPDALADVAQADFLFAINHSAPSLIRVESDEVTYNLHIMLRFDLEFALINGDLQVADLPVAWNDRFQQDFGLTPPDDARGCLQDIHWGAGLFGYFPTYTLGNIYASQLFDTFTSEHPDYTSQFSSGDFADLREWLRQSIHQHGQRYTATDLIQRVTGDRLNQQPLVDHLHGRFGPLYQ